MKRLLLPLLFLIGCAAGPRPVPGNAKAAERFSMAESALLSGKGMTATFELESKGENFAHMTGTLELGQGNALHLVAEGNFKSDPVQLELDSRDSTGTTRTTTKGPSVSSHRDPPASKLRESVTIGLTRMGLMHNLALLSMDQQLEHVEGGMDEWVKALELKDGAAETINGEACRRVEFVVQVETQKMGDASLCISDVTGLPLQRNSTIHFPTGDMTLVETFKWKVQ
jgi:hypothetical protein